MGRHCLTMMTFGVPKDNVHSRIRLVIHMSRDMSEKNRARTNVGPVIGRPRKPRSVADPRSNRASAQVSVCLRSSDFGGIRPSIHLPCRGNTCLPFPGPQQKPRNPIQSPTTPFIHPFPFATLHRHCTAPCCTPSCSCLYHLSGRRC